jgi:hypothetical protein
MVMVVAVMEWIGASGFLMMVMVGDSGGWRWL